MNEIGLPSQCNGAVDSNQISIMTVWATSPVPTIDVVWPKLFKNLSPIIAPLNQ